MKENNLCAIVTNRLLYTRAMSFVLKIDIYCTNVKNQTFLAMIVILAFINQTFQTMNFKFIIIQGED